VNRDASNQVNILRVLLVAGVVLMHAYAPVGLPGADVQASQQQPLALFVESVVVNLCARPSIALFFLFSGFFLYRKEPLNTAVWRAKVKDRVVRIGLLYLIWNGAIFALYFVGQSISQARPFFTKAEYDIAALSWWQRADLVLGITRFPIDYQFWFLRDLILLVIVSPLLWLGIKYARIPLICALLLLWSGPLDNLPYPFSGRSVLFFTIGLGLGQLSGESLRIPHGQGYVVAFLILSTLQAALRVPLSVDRFAIAMTLLSKVNVLIGVCAMWTVAAWLREKSTVTRVISFMKQYSIFIFAAHEPLLMTIKKLSYAKLGHDTNGKLLAVFFASTALTILLCLAAGIMLNHLLPSVYQVVTGEYRRKQIKESKPMPSRFKTPKRDIARRLAERESLEEPGVRRR
jgi:surface polysaccharide O-acyltransferase-like enzyme